MDSTQSEAYMKPAWASPSSSPLPLEVYLHVMGSTAPTGSSSFCPPEESPDLEHVDVWSNWDFLRPVAEEGGGAQQDDGGELHRQMLDDEELFYEKLRAAHQFSGRTGLIGDTREEAPNLYALYKEVTCRGGLAQVIQNSRWEDVASALKWTTKIYFPLIFSYLDLLYQFEKVHFSGHGHVTAQCDEGHFTTPKIAENTFADPLCNAEVSQSLKRKRRQRLASKVGVYMGTTVTGAIINKFESGYIATVTVGKENLHGVLYHVETCVAKQFAAAPVLVSTLGADSKHVRPNVRTDSSKQISDERSSRLSTKDIDMPLGARSCYQIFIKEELCRMKKLKLDLDNKGIWKMVLDSWRCLPKDGRLVYIEKSRKDRERYEIEMAAYHKHNDRKNTKLEDEQCPSPLSPLPQHLN